MKYESYETVITYANNSIFEFTSVGRHGPIRKLIILRPIDNEDDHFELLMGDIQGTEINFQAVSDNGDMIKILTTIFVVIDRFLEQYPHIIIFFTGSTPVRTRLYRMAINHYSSELLSKYEINVRCEGEKIPFAKNLNADAFYITKRS